MSKYYYSNGNRMIPPSEKYRKQRSKKSKKISLPKLQSPLAATNTDDSVSKIKSSIGCPSHLLDVLLVQTDLDEATLHTRYMKFRMMYPTGFVGPHVLRELCIDVLNESDCEKFVDMVFQLYGHQKRGWGAKLIGFREVILATESLNKLKEPYDILQWIFRVFDAEGKGEIPVSRLQDIVRQIIMLCTNVPDEETIEMFTNKIILDFEIQPYDTPFITSEEFVFDFLNNEKIFNILRKSFLKEGDSSSSSSENEEENEDENEDKVETEVDNVIEDDNGRSSAKSSEATPTNSSQS